MRPLRLLVRHGALQMRVGQSIYALWHLESHHDASLIWRTPARHSLRLARAAWRVVGRVLAVHDASSLAPKKGSSLWMHTTTAYEHASWMQKLASLTTLFAAPNPKTHAVHSAQASAVRISTSGPWLSATRAQDGLRAPLCQCSPRSLRSSSIRTAVSRVLATMVQKLRLAGAATGASDSTMGTTGSAGGLWGGGGCADAGTAGDAAFPAAGGCGTAAGGAIACDSPAVAVSRAATSVPRWKRDA